MSQQSTNQSFDDLARALAEGSISRRRALRLFAGTALAALIPSRALAEDDDDECIRICHIPFDDGRCRRRRAETRCLSKEDAERHLKNHRCDCRGSCASTDKCRDTTSTTTSTTSTSTSTTSTSTTTMCIPDGGDGCTADSECCNDAFFCDDGTCSDCRETSTCTFDEECCTGICDNNGQCSGCRLPGDFCTDGNECCFGLCENGICCNQQEGFCDSDIHCCGDLICDTFATCVPPP